MAPTRLPLLLALAAVAALAGCVGLGAEDAQQASVPDPGEAVDEARDWARQIPPDVQGLEAVGFADGTESAAGLWTDGDHAYVAGNNGGFYVVNLTTPEDPQVVGHLPDQTSRDVDLLRYDDGRVVAVLADSSGGMRFVDVTDPRDPQHLATVLGSDGDPEANVHNLAVAPGTHVVYNSRSLDAPGVDVVDASDPANPEVLSTFGDLTCHDVTFDDEGNRAYCAGVRETQIWDLADPEAPEVVTRIYNPAIQIHHWARVTPDGETLLIGDEFAGSTAAAAGCYAHADVPAGGMGDRAASDPVGALWVYDVSDEEHPVPLGWVAPDVPADNAPPAPCTAHFGELVPGQDKVVVGWRTAGTVLVDFSDPTAPRVLDSLHPDAENWEARIHNGWVFTGDTRHGLGVRVLTGS